MEATNRVRCAIRYVFYACCAGVVFFAALAIPAFFANPFAGFAGGDEFVELNGEQAQDLLQSWPSEVNPIDVHAVSYKHASSRDSFSSWYCIRLAPDAASVWSDDLHDSYEQWNNRNLSNVEEGSEGVHRTVPGPPPLHRQTGKTPSWWLPPKIEFRASELMIWYSGFDSGVGRASYSAYDATTETLWVYEYACQHDILWPPGKIPDGEIFLTVPM